MAENVLSKVNHVDVENDDEVVIMGLAVGTVIDFSNCKVTKMQFQQKDGSEYIIRDINGDPIDRNFYSVTTYDSNGQKLSSYSLDLLRYSSRVSKTLSLIGKLIIGTTKLAVEKSLQAIGKVECTAINEETKNERTVKGTDWKKVKG
jgi:hypothetical protein